MRYFNFFDVDLVRDDDDSENNTSPSSSDNNTAHSFFESLDITSCSRGPNDLAVGDAQGGITLLSRSLKPRRFLAHDERVNLVHQLIDKQVLVSVGDAIDSRPLRQRQESQQVSLIARARLQQSGAWAQELGDLNAVDPATDQQSLNMPTTNSEMKNTPVIKIWKLDRMTARGTPQCVRTFRLSMAEIPISDQPPWPLDHWPAVTCLDVSDDNTQLAIGLANGFTFLIVGDLTRDRGQRYFTLPPPAFVPIASSTLVSSPSKSASAAANAAFMGAGMSQASLPQKSRVGGAAKVFVQTYPSVTNVAFDVREEVVATGKHASKPTFRRVVWLWVTSAPSTNGKGGVRAFHTASETTAAWLAGGGSRSKTADKAKDILLGPLVDTEGVAQHCAIVAEHVTKTTYGNVENDADAESHINLKSGNVSPASLQNTFLVLAKREQLKYFTPEDPGACYAIPGDKQHIHSFGDYLVMVSVGGGGGGTGLTVASNAKLPSNAGAVGVDNQRSQLIQLFDFRNKLVGLRMVLPSDAGSITHMATQWGMLFVITSKNRLYRFVEHDTSTKLQDLFRQNLYSTAVSLAHAARCGPATIADIYRMYGDHLYGKGSFGDALLQYLETIGHVEPSYVIRRYLDAQRITHLTTYLQAFHRNPRTNPTADLTTLLLRCYTKQRRVEELSLFVKDQRIKFDVDSAMIVLKEAGYVEEAVYLADRHGKLDWYFDLQVEALKTRRDNEENTSSAGDKPHLTNDTTATTTRDVRSNSNKHEHEDGGVMLSASQLLHRIVLLADHNDALRVTLRHGRTLLDVAETDTLVVLLSLCEPEWNGRTVKHMLAPSDLSALFADHPRPFRHFLEQVLRRPHITQAKLDEPRLWGTLLELTLLELELMQQEQQQKEQQVNDNNVPAQLPDVNETADTLEKKVMDILRDGSAKVEPNQALLLVQAAGFKRGELYLYEKLHMHEMLIQSYMHAGDHFAVITKSKLHGPRDPAVWSQVLRYFVRLGCSGEDGTEQPSVHNEEIAQVLGHIERHNVLPPMLVVEILSSNPDIPLHIALPYLQSQLHATQSSIEQDQHEIDQLSQDTEGMKEQIRVLREDAQVFKNTTCNLTGAPLQLPTIHFLSGNSYNLSALPDTSGGKLDRLEDPKRAADQQAVFDIVEGLKRRSEKGAVDEEFLRDMEVSADGFKTVAEYFGKCLFSKFE